ncbi:MAG: hypothetical protein AAGI50_11610 [Pseudomonadota bacterium]
MIDGHHRLEAFRRYADTAKGARAGEAIPVTVSDAKTPAEAALEAGWGNSRDKLPMTSTQKVNVAWQLVCVGEDGSALSKSQIKKATGVANGTVGNMRQVTKELLAAEDGLALEKIGGWAWDEARSAARGEKHVDYNQGALERQAEEWARRLKKAFSNKLATNPEAFARAVQLYSQSLPQRLIASDA